MCIGAGADAASDYNSPAKPPYTPDTFWKICFCQYTPLANLVCVFCSSEIDVQEPAQERAEAIRGRLLDGSKATAAELSLGTGVARARTSMAKEVRFFLGRSSAEFACPTRGAGPATMSRDLRFM